MNRLLVMPRRETAKTSLDASPLRLQGARLLLVTGTGGSGKRIVGNLLVDDRSYVHIDLDNPHARQRFVGQGLDHLREELEANLEPGQDTVITWTPPQKLSDRSGALPLVRLMQSYGFDWVWMDGDRGAAFHGYFSVRNAEAARFVDPFEADGTFRPVTAVLEDVLEPGPAAQPVPARRRLRREAAAFGRRGRRPQLGDPQRPRVRPAGRRARAGLAGGVAFVMASVAAAAYVLAGGLGGNGTVPAAQARPAAVPVTGILVSGKSLGGVQLGDTTSDVRKIWGHRFVVCEGCEPTTWFYWSTPSTGVGVEFRHSRVTGVYTLGLTAGWRSTDGLKVGSYMSSKELHEKSVWRNCSGYSAKLQRSRGAVTSIFTVGPMVYGFSLTRPDESVCQ